MQALATLPTAGNAEDILKTEAETLPSKANRLVIVDQATYDEVVEVGKGANALAKSIKDHYAPMKEAAHLAHKRICDAEKAMLAPVEQAVKTLKGKIAEYTAEQQRKQREEQARLELETRRREEEERLKMAEEAQQDGASAEVVDEILETAAPVVIPKAAPGYQAANGVSTRKNYRAKVVSIKDLCRAVADGVIPESFVNPNQTALNGRATSDKEGFSIPGCELVIETGTVFRS